MKFPFINECIFELHKSPLKEGHPLIYSIDRCNSTIEFSKYEFNNKLLSGVILIRAMLGVT